jgi:hypothetical protein
MALIPIVVFFAGYFVVGPLLLLIAVRIFLWLGGALELPNALGVFGADTRRAFLAHTRALEREFGAGSHPRTE